MTFRALAFLGFFGLVVSSIVIADEPVLYDRQIRPILSTACFQCHGPDGAARKANLRLDKSESATASHDGHIAVVPGKPDDSELIKRITSSDPDFQMPPPKAGSPLAPEKVAMIRQWIAQGASWSRHWAFIPPKRPAVPAVDDKGWSRNPIDTFILARLDKEGLKPSPEADRETLVRRLTLDLTGLPPTIDEINAALADKSDTWYESVVDRLLDSPHYGERWARYWMDAAQYADSDGFEKDKPREVWAWRDWVINAFNRDMPYNRFVVEQVAGDMLPNATQDQIVATGFLRNSMINEEGGIDPEQFRMEAQFNRMSIIGQAVLGLTVQCAQCHSHKYDPLTHTEYYGMLAFLNNEYEACTSVYSPSDIKQRDSILALVNEIEDGIKSSNADWRERMAAWENSVKALPSPHWETLPLVMDDSSAGGQKCIAQGDGSFLAEGYAPTQFGPKMTATTTLSKITAARLELLPDPNLPRGGPGRSTVGACALSEFEMRVSDGKVPVSDYDKWTPIKFASAIADINPHDRELGPEFPVKDSKHRVTGPIAMAIDGNAETAWTTDVNPIHRNEAHFAIFKLAEPLAVTPGMVIIIRPVQQHGGWNSDDNENNNLGRFRVSVTDSDTLPDKAIPDSVQRAIAIPSESRSVEQNEIVFAQWRSSVPEFADATTRIDTLLRGIPSGTTQLVYKERETPRATHRLVRGDFLHPAEEVSPGVPAFLNTMKTSGAPNRLDFARWLVTKDSPTTARAFVNRIWQQFYGQGIVATSADLGTQGDVPTHPELLDWLAVEFMDSGWDIKHMQRLMVTSATYRQASKTTPELQERDPYNRLLARGGRFRLEGETVRDVALAASGLLNPTLGGPSVHPQAPDYLFQPPASYGPKTWHTEEGANQYRRALYTFRFRSVPYPALQTFDTPVGDAPCTRRVRSNSPLQALTTLNEPIFFDCARGLAGLTLTEGGDNDRSRIAYAFRRCVARAPEQAEVATLQQFLEKQRQRIAAGEIKSDAVLGDAAKTAEASNKNINEYAAWTLTARVMLNLDETITHQ